MVASSRNAALFGSRETPTGTMPFNASTYLIDRHVAEGRGDRVAILGSAGTLTYAQLADMVSRTAAGLRSLGVRPGERVVMAMSDGPQLVATMFATMRIGAVALPINTMLKGRELGEILRDSRAGVLVVSAEFTAPAEAGAALATELRDILVTGGAELSTGPRIRVRAWVDLLNSDGDAAPYETWADSTGLWLYTSGTTGRPKGAMHRHVNIAHVVEAYGRQVLGIGPDDRCLAVPRLFFAYGLGASALFPFAAGASTVLEPSPPTPPLMAERLAEYRPTLFFAVPSFYAALLSAAEEGTVDPKSFASVRLAVSAGEALPPSIYHRFTERFAVELLDGIGTTEALHIFLSNRSGTVRPGSTGTPVPGYELRLLDDAGREVGDDEPGHLHVKGPSIALGYWCRTDITRQVFQGEWLRTGDMYSRSADGYYTCLGRSNDMIKAGGQWVSPTEVEARLLEHPAVALVAVVGLPDEQGLEQPVACVVRAPGASVEAVELVEFCRAGLAAFKRPREVVFMDALPTTATGKIQRFAVRDSLRPQR